MFNQTQDPLFGSSIRTRFLTKRPKSLALKVSPQQPPEPPQKPRMTYLQIQQEKAKVRYQRRQTNSKLKRGTQSRAIINQTNAYQELELEELKQGQCTFESKCNSLLNQIQLLQFSGVIDHSNQITSVSSTTPQHQPDPNINKHLNKKIYLHEIWHLTYTLLTVDIPVTFIMILFVVLASIRYYTIAYLINLAIKSHSQYISWVAVFIGDRVLYFLLVVKISLNSAQTKTEITLKSHWNCQESQINELFLVINREKLLKSILRGLIPAQLSFFYLKGSPRKKLQIYIAINYIYASIEAVTYFPFFIAYIKVVGVNYHFALDSDYNHATLTLVILALSITFGLSLFLFVVSVRRKCARTGK